MESIFSTQNLQTFLRRKNLRPPSRPPPPDRLRDANRDEARDLRDHAGLVPRRMSLVQVYLTLCLLNSCWLLAAGF